MAYDSDSDEEEIKNLRLCISKAEANQLYDEAGKEVDEADDEISMTGHEYLLQDTVHLLILVVLKEHKVGFALAPFQMRSLHLILISPTGSGKMLDKNSLCLKHNSVMLSFFSGSVCVEYICKVSKANCDT